MRHVICDVCKTVVQLGGDPPEISYLLGSDTSWECPTPLCGGRVRAVTMMAVPTNYTYRELPVKAFYRAVHGFGSGEGDPASLSDVRSILLAGKIASIDADQVGQPLRVIVRSITFEDGSKLHFDASSRGACIYYLERPAASCTESVINELNTSTTPEVGHQDREEARRAPEADVEVSAKQGRSNRPTGGAVELPNSERVSVVSETSGV